MAQTEFQPVTCNLNGGGTVTFDVTDTTVWDINETFTVADYFNSVIGA